MNQLVHLIMIIMLLAAAQKTHGQDSGCPTGATCDTTGTACLGYGDLSLTCGNGTRVSFGPCYLSDLCARAAADQGNDWIKITANNVNPVQCYRYSDAMKQSLMGAYNTWCCQADNYLKCCPGSIGWPAGVAKSPANCAAMRNYSTEVAYAGASGGAAQTRFFLQLQPKADSALCQLLNYSIPASGSGSAANASGSGVTTITTAAAAATTTVTNGTSDVSAASTTTRAAAAPAATTAATNASSNGTAAGKRRRRRDLQDSDEELVEETESDAVAPLIALQDRSRRAATISGSVITLDSGTVQLLIAAIDIPGLVTSAISVGSNYTLSATVTVEQNVAPAFTLSPDRLSSSWIIATGTLCGLLAAMMMAYLIACAVHRSKNKGDRLPL